MNTLRRKLGDAVDAEIVRRLKPVVVAAAVGCCVGVCVGMALSAKLGAPRAEVRV